MQLTAGKLTMHYENGFLRWITAGEYEVLRMIYFAVRDKVWGTVPSKIINEKIEQYENSFTVSYEMLFEQDDIKIQWNATIEGNTDNSIVFEIKGKALNTFKKNRTGFCVLHPIKECTGKKVLIQHADGSLEENIFPDYISPHQPFKNIAAMQWFVNDDCKVTVQFEGDIFETEDHRNWTDNNYKTYCTPLEIPFPVTMQTGDEVHQKIIVKVEGSFIKQGNNDAIEIVMENEKLPIPKIGVGRANERNENYYEALKALSAIGFSHYRVDIKLNNDDWQQTLKECFNEAALLNTKLEIALFVYAGCTKKISVFVDAIKSRKDIQQIILLEEHAKCISNHLLHEVLFMLRPQLPGIIIGAGTDIYFAELNRSNLDTSDIDYVSYSANPQVHAFDDASLMENTEGQFATVISAKNKFIKPVHISPVTLKMRYNADAGEQNTYALTPLADARQQTFFGAAWTLLSLKELCEARVSSVTYFETVGKTGLMDADTFQSYPLLEVFKLLYPSSIYYIKKSNCIPDNMQCNSFVFGNDHIQFTAVCNYGESEIQLNLKDHADLYTIVIFSKKKDNAKQTTTKKLPIAYRLLLPGQSIIFIEKRLK